MEDLIKHIKEVYKKFDESCLEGKPGYFQPVTLKKGQLLHKKGTICNQLYFIKSGYLRNFFINSEGKDITTWFCFEGEFITVFESFFLQIKSKEGIEALTDCELICISHNKFNSLIESGTEWERVYRLFVSHYAVQQDVRIYMLQTLHAAEKYDYIREHYPKITWFIPNKFIASFLGITNETLSRIRAKK